MEGKKKRWEELRMVRERKGEGSREEREKDRKRNGEREGRKWDARKEKGGGEVGNTKERKGKGDGR